MAFIFEDKGLMYRTKLFSNFVALATGVEKAAVSGLQCFVCRSEDYSLMTSNV